jgi:hypothetical protein
LKIIYLVFFVSVPVKNGEEESTNTFISSSLQQSPSTDGSTKEEIPVTEENANLVISTIVPDDEHKEIEQNKQLISEVSEEKKDEEEEQRQQVTPVSPLCSLNPEASPFVVVSTNKIASTQSISTGDESDDENDSNETPVSSGK